MLFSFTLNICVTQKAWNPQSSPPDMDKIEHNLEAIPPPRQPFKQRLKDAIKMFLTFPIFKYKHIGVFLIL